MSDDDWYFDNRNGTPDPAWPVLIGWLVVVGVLITAGSLLVSGLT